MSWKSRIINGFSLVILALLFVFSSLFVGAQVGIIDMEPEPETEAPENTTGVPEVTASNYPAIDGEELEMAIHETVNERRTTADIEPFVHSERVRLIARIHSKDMAERDFFDHTNPDGEGSRERHERYDGCSDTNENIIMISPVQSDDIDELAERVVTDWEESPGHNKSMMTTYDKVTGVGVHITENGTLYATQNFCREHPNA